MYIMYVDESGDPGLLSSLTKFFVLSGIVVHETDWRMFIEKLVSFRRTMRATYGLPIRSEIHASQMINRKNTYSLQRHIRLAILRNFLDELAKMSFISVTNIVVCKQGKPSNYDVFTEAWKVLFQRFENTLQCGNFPGGHKNDYGLVVTDATSGTKLVRLMRRMAVFNHIPHDLSYGAGSRNMPIKRIIEDPHGKDSRQTLPIQACDVVAYALLQKLAPNSYIRRKFAGDYFDRLLPVLNVRASRKNPLGVVYL